MNRPEYLLRTPGRLHSCAPLNAPLLRRDPFYTEYGERTVPSGFVRGSR